ncbi:MAG: FHA domain-containing protein, partial [Acetivibrio sp.]
PLEIYVEENTVLLTPKGYFLCPVNGRDYGDMELSEFPFFIGKLKKKMNGIIESETISRFHAKIEKDENQFYLVDLNSTNGTFLNGERLAIKERYPLFIGDEIKFADVAYNFTKI